MIKMPYFLTMWAKVYDRGASEINFHQQRIVFIQTNCCCLEGGARKGVVYGVRIKELVNRMV